MACIVNSRGEIILKISSGLTKLRLTIIEKVLGGTPGT